MLKGNTAYYKSTLGLHNTGKRNCHVLMRRDGEQLKITYPDMSTSQNPTLESRKRFDWVTITGEEYHDRLSRWRRKAKDKDGAEEPDCSGGTL